MAGAVRYCAKIAHKQGHSKCRLRWICGVEQNISSGHVPKVKEIVIPKQKLRNELSILEALATTVHKDYNGPHLKYMDDPYLIPATAVDKRTFALSKASGQRAARSVMDKFPQNFGDNFSDPVIPDYMPDIGYKHIDNTVEGLQERITKRKVSDSYNSYLRLKEADTSIDDGTIHDLLALLCVYNSEESKASLLPLENFYKQDTGEFTTSRMRKTWNDQGAAEILFKEMKSNSPLAYSTLIRGRAKYLQVDKAYELYREMKELKMPVDIGTHNAIIKIASFIDENADRRWELVQEILRSMKESEVCPNLVTFNAILQMLGRSRHTANACTQAMKVFNEMKTYNIEPSLGSWNYLITIFYNHDDVQSNILYDIMDNIEGKEFSIQQPEDTNFFHQAMIKCFTNLKDMELAYRLDKLLNTGNNIALLGDGFKEGLYYTFYVRLLCMFEQMDTIMKEWNRITPHTYTPSFTALDDLLRAVDLNDGFEYLPGLWSDLVLFEYTRRQDLVENMLSIMSKKRQSPELQDMFMNIVKATLERFELDSQNKRLMRPFQYTGAMIGDMCIISLNSDDPEAAWGTLELYITKKRRINGFPSEQSLASMTDHFLRIKDVDRSIQTLSLMSDFGYPKLDALVEKAKSELELSDRDKNHLDDLL